MHKEDHSLDTNQKVRFKNRQFLLGVVGALGTGVLALANAFGLGECALPWVEAIEGVATATLTVLALLGVVVDPTTQGAGDSSQALRYEVPRPKPNDENGME